MNPTIIVQQNIGIPAGPLTDGDSKSETGQHAKSVAAIIRPVPGGSGASGTLRVDPANTSTAKPHVRTYELDDYVKWLRNRFKEDKTKNLAAQAPVQVPTIKPAQPESAPERSSSEQSPIKNVATTSIPVELEPVVAESITDHLVPRHNVLSGSYFSTITTDTEFSKQETIREPAQEKHREAAPSTPRARGFSTASYHRVDQPHAGLPKTYVTFDELTAAGDGVPAVSFDPSLIDTTETVSDFEQPKKLNPEQTEEFIATISKAIASVLTETPEPEFEQRVRDHFESELQARAIRSIAQSEIESIDTDKLDHARLDDLLTVGGKPSAAMQVEANKIAEEILNSSRKDIPTSVAAWDVEDFRWPVVSNQMIVSGGEALDQLCKSAFEMITSGHQRLAVAGLGRKEGTTSIAISLARWAAACGKNVLLVDADLVSPSLSTQVGLAPNLSWINAVSQSLPPAEVIVRSQNSNLCVMPMAQMVSRVTWPRFIYDNLGEVLDQVKKHFDLVVLDVGPANQLLAELSRPSLLVDATLLIHNGVNSPEFQKTKSRLEMFGLNKFIVAHNRAQQKSANVA